MELKNIASMPDKLKQVAELYYQMGVADALYSLCETEDAPLRIVNALDAAKKKIGEQLDALGVDLMDVTDFEKTEYLFRIWHGNLD